MTDKTRFVIVVWAATVPALLFAGFAGLYGGVTIPLFMTAPTFVAMLLTFPLIADRPGVPSLTIALLFLAQLACAAGVLFALSGSDGTVRRGIGVVAFAAGSILPFILTAVVIRSTLRRVPPTPPPLNEEL